MPRELVESLAVPEPEGFEVWPANMPVIDAWLGIATQWDVVPMPTGAAYWQGLDYARVRAGLILAGRTIAPDVWAGVQVMETAAAAVLNGYRG